MSYHLMVYKFILPELMFSRLSSITETTPNCRPKIHKNTGVRFRVPFGHVPSHRYSNFLASALEE